MPARPLGETKRRTFKVETTWPDSTRPSAENDVFGSYYASAYTDVRDPGSKFDKMLVNTQKGIFDKRSTSRFGGHSESLEFDNVGDAIVAARFIERWGRMGCGWDSASQEKHQKEKRGPLKVRVVEEFSLTKRVAVNYESDGPADDYEIELAALKKKHGRN